MKPAFTALSLLWTLLFTAGLAHAQSADNNKVKSKKKELTMMTVQTNKATMLKLFEESLNKRNLELLKDLVADEYTGIRLKGAAGFSEPVIPLIKAFPDMQWTVDEMVGEDNKITVRWTVRGTHTAPFNNLPPTGNKVANTGIGFFELKDGKIISGQVQTDRLGFLQQLDVLPDDVNVIYANAIKALK